ncbi:MAG TPA: YCF48-related protein, partial [Cytophagaceae bacterium]|nr:YCF48-related protein [Cytophagaceae bacterium]
MKIKVFILFILFFPVIYSCRKSKCPVPTTSTTENNLMPTSLSGYLLAVDFPTPTTGYISGNNGAVYKTTDGGQTYQNICPLSGYDYYSLDFVSATTGYLVNSYSTDKGNVYKTTDGGQNWVLLSVPTTQWRCVKFINTQVGFVGGGVVNDSNYNGNLYRTADGGNTWTQIVISNLKSVTGIYFVDANIGHMSCDEGQVYVTSDGGQTWTLQNLNLNTTLPTTQLITGDIFFKNANEGYCLTRTVYYNDMFLMKTMDGGNNWSRIALPASGFTTSNSYVCIAFADNNTGYISGGNITEDKGVILKSTDGGSTWFQ